MLTLKEILPEHQALMNVIIQNINNLYTLQKLFDDSEDKFLAGFALKNAALYMKNLVINGSTKYVPVPTPPAAPLNEPNPAMECQSDGTIGDTPDTDDAA